MKKKWLYWFIPLFLIFLFLHQILSLISIRFGACKVNYLNNKVRLFTECKGPVKSTMDNVLNAYAFTLGNNIFTYGKNLSENTIAHELGHVYQYKKLGPLFLPAYGIAQIVAIIDSKINDYPNVHAGNYFEIWANRIANLEPENKYLGLLTATPTPSTEIKNVEEWKYFESKELNMAFKYPADWVIESKNGTSSYVKITSPNLGIIYLNPPDQGMTCVKEISKEKILLDGLTVDKIVQKEITEGDICSGDSENPYMFIVITASKNDNYYLIIARWKSKTESDFEGYFDKVIASFKFLD